jgi:hypothetical protein
MQPGESKAEWKARGAPKRLVGYFVVQVYDVRHTEGDPLPEIAWADDAVSFELEERLVAFAEGKGITMEVRDTGQAMGVSTGGAVYIHPDAGTDTVVHEIAHELLHQGDDRNKYGRADRECHAEAVAHTVCSYFGMELENSPNYLALYGLDSDKIREHLTVIRKCAVEIIKACEPKGSKDV